MRKTVVIILFVISVISSVVVFANLPNFLANDIYTFSGFVTFKTYPTMLELSHSTIDIYIGQVKQINAYIYPSNVTENKLSWTSNTSAVYVTQNGVITANAVANAVITVETENGLKARCNVRVLQQEVSATSVVLGAEEYHVVEKGIYYLDAVVYPANTTNKNLVWESSNPSVATINQDGMLTVIGEGVTTIYVYTTNGKSDYCNVYVEL